MDILNRHEVFEIEVLDRLKNKGLLEPLVFGGGTMLRLCFELNRYSTDLDFWFIKDIDEKSYFKELNDFLGKYYEITDSNVKFYTILIEIRSMDYPKRLKLEIRRGLKEYDFQERIAFSSNATKQVVLKVCTLEQMMKNKIKAALDRKGIRDCFDIEFLLRQGVGLPANRDELDKLRIVINGFRDNDYKVVLGSILDAEQRLYYINNKFEYILRKISE
ncbi:MAG: nucleotidyl transferase AbiEii/AbiGii toxin family protein [Candidatus Omnitrophota bacterium]